MTWEASLRWVAVSTAVLAALFFSEFVTDFAIAHFMIEHRVSGWLVGGVWGAIAFGPWAFLVWRDWI